MCPFVRRTMGDSTSWAILTTLCKEKLQAADHIDTHEYVPQIEESQVIDDSMV